VLRKVLIVEHVPTRPLKIAKTARARGIVADMLGINDRYVGYAAELADKAPALLEDVFQGKISLMKAVNSLKPAPTAESVAVCELHGVKRSLVSIRQKLSGRPEALALVEKLEAELAALIEENKTLGSASGREGVASGAEDSVGQRSNEEEDGTGTDA